MKLNKAIEILTQLERTLAPIMSADGTDAIKLGIEALEAVAFWSQQQLPQHQIHLPGETKE